MVIVNVDGSDFIGGMVVGDEKGLDVIILFVFLNDLGEVVGFIVVLDVGEIVIGIF